MTMSASVEAALTRKQRLLQLKRKQLKGEDVTEHVTEEVEASTSETNNDVGNESESTLEKRMRFRNYEPLAEDLKENKDKVLPQRVEPQILDQLTLAKDVSVVEDVDVANLEPRKIDWDLKRDVAKKLEKLERRTKRAIAELIRERLAEGKISEMDVAVNQGASAAAMLEGDDD